ncbi:hypothetical protein [Pseudotenacibaculum haliotis]|uniref:Peptidase MA-like domain-containing protein n=1 Tax=Pseudotenacibaculum haliotis TaxID=1862138 RepID=A0ABW5LSL6_9FLAO
MKRTLLFALLFINSFFIWGQIVNIIIDKNVENAEDPNEKEIIKVWSEYLQSGEYKNPETKFWDQSQYQIPDYFLWPVGMKTLKDRTPKVQCTILGVFSVENDHYAIKTALTHINKEGDSVLEAILSVYAKKINGKYLLVNSSQYHKGVWQKEQVGNITYYVHPNHPFDLKAAQKMNAFNEKMAKTFKTNPISFDYFVSNYSREIVRLWGYDYMAKIYIPGQTGGLADINNSIVYAGNNSEYYPHEVVHLYTHQTYDNGYHFWLDEGFATFMAGSGGHDLAWHTQKLKEFLAKNPDFIISFKKLRGYIPNGLHSTEFRYVIGGLICKKIYEKRGMTRLLEGLKTVKTDEELYGFIEKELGIKAKDFTDYIRKTAK